MIKQENQLCIYVVPQAAESEVRGGYGGSASSEPPWHSTTPRVGAQSEPRTVPPSRVVTSGSHRVCPSCRFLRDGNKYKT